MREIANSNKLSARERQVVRLAARGYANKTIARELSVTEGTIKVHLHNVYQKLGIRSRVALLFLANNGSFTANGDAEEIDAAGSTYVPQ